MNIDKEKMYFLTMTEFIINNNVSTDLGNYVLEYTYDYGEIGDNDFDFGETGLSVAVRLKNKSTGKVEWGNIYSKRFPQSDSKEQITTFAGILDMTPEEKMKYISRLETKILRRPYIVPSFIEPTLSSFFRDLNSTSVDYPSVKIAGKIPKDAREAINNVYEEIVLNNALEKSEIKTK